VKALIGPHPAGGTPFGSYLDHSDGQTVGATPHRALAERDGARPTAITLLRAAIERHHASPEQLARTERARAALMRQGIPLPKGLLRFPSNVETRKGNFAEIVLAEYVQAASGATLPVYRLRHNPNVEQSMKGDDVLAFDLDANPTRIIVGEAKFRKVATATVVGEIVDALARSQARSLPVSLQFVADHVSEPNLAERIMACARLLADRKARIDYVGLLLSDTKATAKVAAHEGDGLRRLALLSLGVHDPELLVSECYRGLT
jgi:hypothetical protein